MSEKAIISVDRELDPIKAKNLFFSVIAIHFMWMLFHFTVVFFFTLQLQSVALVWIFLAIWNLFAFLLDIPIWVIQNYYKSKTLYIISFITQLIAIIIFANFIFQVTDFLTTSLTSNTWIVWTALNFFLWNWLNIILLLIASICYWITRELQDITTISYILNNWNPSQYANIIAKNNIAMWIWGLFWLILSWIILTFSPKLIIFSIILIIVLILLFTSKFFDNWEKTINLKDIYKFKVFFEKENIEWIKNDLKNKIVKSVNTIELKNLIQSTKYIFIKPQVKKSWLTFKLLISETKTTFINTYNVIKAPQSSLLIYWSIIMVLTFWFRDTFASTFLIDFLNDIKIFWKWWWSYLLLWIIAIPAFWLQWFFSKLAEKHWAYTIANIWLLLSWISLFLMWIFSNSSVLIIMVFAVINSIWYASCMSLSQAVFLDQYNKSYANFNNLKEIDANASAAPMKILQNLANVFWLFFWWLILAILHYLGFFIVFGSFIIWFLYWSIKKRKEINK